MRTKQHKVQARTKRRPVKDGFWKEKTLEELAAEQGVKPVKRFDDSFGAGRRLWKDDEDFEAFLQELKRARNEGRK
jgi:hypothetical protein